MLFAQTAEIDVAADPDKADSYSPVDPDKAPPPPSEDKDPQSLPKKGVLRDYIESFDQQTLADTARCGTSAVCLFAFSARFADVTLCYADGVL